MCENEQAIEDFKTVLFERDTDFIGSSTVSDWEMGAP